MCQPQQTLAAVVTSVQSICRTFKSNYKTNMESSNMVSYLSAFWQAAVFSQSISHQWTDGYFPDPNIDPQVDQAYFAPPSAPPPPPPPTPHLPHGFNYDMTCLLYRLSLICFYHQRDIKQKQNEQMVIFMSRFGLAVRLVSRETSIGICFGSPFSSKVVVCGHRLVTLSLTIN